jgi:hypothetical protein
MKRNFMGGEGKGEREGEKGKGERGRGKGERGIWD